MNILGRYVLLFSVSVLFFVSCAVPYDSVAPPSPYGKYSVKTVNYFQEIGFGSEFKNSRNIVKKWTSSPISVGLHGSYTDADKEELRSIISDLSRLTGLSFHIIDNQHGDMNIHFIPQNQFRSVLPDYDPGVPQDGFFKLDSHLDGVIAKATILIREDLQGSKRDHILREEFTQCMGLMKDSLEYTNSIFQQDPSFKPVKYARIDEDIIRLLYDERVKPGMTEDEVLNALRTSNLA